MIISLCVGVDVNTQTTSKRTALMEAVCLNRHHLVDILVNAGANPDLEDVKGASPLDYSVMLPKIDIKIVNRLLEGETNSHISKRVIDRTL